MFFNKSPSYTPLSSPGSSFKRKPSRTVTALVLITCTTVFVSGLKLFFNSQRLPSLNQQCLFLEPSSYSPFFPIDIVNSIFRPNRIAVNGVDVLHSRYPQAPVHQPFVQAINGDLNTFYNIHSHNDYWRSLPLFDALERNFKSIEADVWYHPSSPANPQCLTNIDDDDNNNNNNNNDNTVEKYSSLKNFKESELYVGHHSYLLSKDKTINSVYIDPLSEMLTNRNQQSDSDAPAGVFWNFPNESLNFIIDIKSKESYLVYQLLLRKLKPVKQYLSYYDFELEKFVENQINIILSGNIPLAEIVAEDEAKHSKNKGKRFVFIDSHLLPAYSPCPGASDDNTQYKHHLSLLKSTSFHEVLAKSVLRSSNDKSPKISKNVRDSFDIDSTTSSRGLFSAFQLEVLHNATSKVPGNQHSRIWGVPSLEEINNKNSRIPWSWFGTAPVTDDYEVWKDLMITGGISMMNIDNLDLGMEIYDQVYEEMGRMVNED